MKQIIYLSIVFGISELLLTLIKRSKTASSKTRDDKGSMILLWIAITSGFCFGFFLSKPAGGFFEGFGLAFIIFGLIIRWVSIIQLGKDFTVDVAVTKVAELKTDGIYKRVRHPSYTGLLAVSLGFAFTMNSLYSFLIFVVPVFLAIAYRIKVEEQLLSREFGNSYSEYKSRTKRLIPGIY